LIRERLTATNSKAMKVYELCWLSSHLRIPGSKADNYHRPHK
jgi:hypothetical protein